MGMQKSHQIILFLKNFIVLGKAAGKPVPTKSSIASNADGQRVSWHAFAKVAMRMWIKRMVCGVRFPNGGFPPTWCCHSPHFISMNLCTSRRKIVYRFKIILILSISFLLLIHEVILILR